MKLIDISTPSHPNLSAIVDDEDFEFLNQWRWSASIEGERVYAVRSQQEGGRKKKIRMHRLVLGASPGQIVDHVDWNGINNQKSNLRLATASQNNAYRKNTIAKSGYRGVIQHRKKWVAHIKINDQKKYLGLFNTPEEAAFAYEQLKPALEEARERAEKAEWKVKDLEDQVRWWSSDESESDELKELRSKLSLLEGVEKAARELMKCKAWPFEGNTVQIFPTNNQIAALSHALAKVQAGGHGDGHGT